MGQKLTVGITGQGGFMGSHVYNFLGTKTEDIELVNFERNYFENEVDLQKFVKSCDVIVHTAAMNRHEDQQVIYDTNVGLVQKLVNACTVTNSKPKIIFSSSTQEEKDNLYGKSKRDGRQYLENWAIKSDASVASLIIPNVFGPFGKPFYNSFIATFSYQIVQGEEPTVINDSKVNLIYINELSQAFYNEIVKRGAENIQSYVVPHTSSRKVSEILALLKDFKIQYVDNGQVPKVDLNSFELDLFNTFTSFIPKEYFPRKYIKHTDNRGAFVEIMRADSAGQSSYSTTVPGITRGNHYHTRKVERFAVISGRASIKLRKIDSDEVFEYILEGAEPAYVDMPIWYTHNIKNIGDTELITLFWINEPYNSDDADTYFAKV
ncbi:UDP-2-acetamido-2,6-beta-L-arabino-hexul-4-ose reductase [Tenacibaculum sp. MAR_2010_89]|uniref:polysaccharide biosynthesis C-terminal domain-containing protein n=1 Tax=Tenacibaculum sp. MAR_2010_89 TaxID=1250198 RepID=UPI00089D55E1|nr:NAD-dependent epimerase/dehydratase family protein [Tenacibaculum sp. MAR_2010_89]SED67758.1 UDP-2-acetamido-2,6-beta-L-arabino-hexul-4-ose reductase [Tenacibaculum sp. MAR_2010_89]